MLQRNPATCDSIELTGAENWLPFVIPAGLGWALKARDPADVFTVSHLAAPDEDYLTVPAGQSLNSPSAYGQSQTVYVAGEAGVVVELIVF